MKIFSVKNLSFTYPQMQEKALDNVNFTVKRGEFCVICGQSGCGKTTLLRLLKPQAAPHGTKTGVHQTVGTRNLLERIVCGLFAQMVDQQNTDVILVRQCF